MGKESNIRRKARRRDSFSSFSLRRVSSMEFIQRKSSKSPAPKAQIVLKSDYKITPKTESNHTIKYKVRKKSKRERWKPPYSTNNHKNEDFKEERSYIHRKHGGGDGIDDGSMSVLY